MVSFELSEEQAQLQQMVRTFAQQKLRPAMRQAENSGLSDALASAYEELGLWSADWPEAAGGAAMDALTRVLIEEELAFGDVGLAFALDKPGAAAQLLLAAGTDGAAAALKNLGYRHAALAAGEEGPAHDDFRTVATKQGSDFSLNGKKGWVLNGAQAALHVVLAQVEPGKGLSGAGAFAVSSAHASIKPGRARTTLGLQTVPVTELLIEGLKVPAAARLDAPGTLPQLLRRFYDRLSLVTAARAVGLANAAFEYARGYADERVAFGKPIGHFQAIAFLLADMATQVEAARWLTWRAAWACSKEQPATAAICAAQSQALETAFFCANSAVQVLGGAGYVKDHPTEKWMRDAKQLQLYGLHQQAADATLASAELGRSLDEGELFPLPSLHASLT